MRRFNILVLEGPDNGGKSTLAEYLQSHAGLRYVSHLGGRTMDRDALHQRSRDLIYTGDTPVVADRFHPISDYIYRKVFGGERVFSDRELKFFVEGLKTAHAALIYCRPSLRAAQEAEHKMAGDDDAAWMKRVDEQLPAVFKEYDTLMAQITSHGILPVIHYDWTVAWSRDLVRSACAV